MNKDVLIPSKVELALVILTGIGRAAIEVATRGVKGDIGPLNQPQNYYNLAACVLWGSYLIWRMIKTPGILTEWGFRTGGFAAAFRSTILFAAVALVPLLLYGRFMGRFPLPRTFWLVLVLYPLWGLAQQFALQDLVAINLRALIPVVWRRVLATSLLFSVAHFPKYHLMVLTFVAGLVFTWIYERHRNLWAIGIVHGILGAVAYYVVLGHDPGAEIIGLLKHE